MTEYIIVLTTLPSKEEADKLSEKLLKARLIACANISSQMESFFHWKGQISKENEVLVIMKTQKKLFKELSDWILTHHPYDVPEIVALPILMGSDDYLSWIKEETS
jgi:periplasmic divalent cation tolerance protein